MVAEERRGDYDWPGRHLYEGNTVHERRVVHPLPLLHHFIKHHEHGGIAAVTGEQVDLDHQRAEIEEPAIQPKQHAEGSEDAELQMEDDQPQYEVTMISGDQYVEVEIDAVSGRVLGVEREAIELTASHRWTFDKDPVGTLPPDWIIKQNNPTKALARWMIEPDAEATSKPNVLNIKTENANATYNLAIITTAVYRDLNVSVKIRGNTGADDQGGGLIWRCKDENNYYLCRINPIENNYRVYKVVNGKRTQLQSVDFETPAGKWFTLRARMKGNEIACYCNGKKWLEVKDDTFKDAGMIGLWTKADACSSFDNLQAYPITGGPDSAEKKHEPSVPGRAR